VTEAARNGGHLAESQLDFTVLEFDGEPAFDGQKCFV
jgi:hypothetical protein